jgi:superfamily II DNA/RNA helicase
MLSMECASMNPASNALVREDLETPDTALGLAEEGVVQTGLNFADLGLAPVLISALSRLEIASPTPVQSRTIPILLAGRDLIASAPTGTGKTAAFMLPALHRLATADAPRGRGPRVLVLTPTRELAQQVSKAAQSFARQMPRTTTVCITGGESYLLQNKLLSSPHEVLVATPGRLMDQKNSGRIDFSRVEVFVLDEADRMLDMGFSEDVTAIAQALPANRQTVCFTATLTRGVRALAGELLRDPEWMEVERQHTEEAPIDEHVIYVDGWEHRNRLLAACLADEGLGQAIVFTSTKRHADELAGDLYRQGIASQALHGDLSQRDRTKALNKLRRGECKVLVATDVAARGIDVSTITHVINFDLPKFAEDYVHRIGRTGRAGASGQALSFVGRDDVFALRKIEHFIGRKIQVSAIEGLEASFRPLERRPRDGKGGGSFRKPGRGGPNARFGNAGGYASEKTGGWAQGQGAFSRSARPDRASMTQVPTSSAYERAEHGEHDRGARAAEFGAQRNVGGQGQRAPRPGERFGERRDPGFTHSREGGGGRSGAGGFGGPREGFTGGRQDAADSGARRREGFGAQPGRGTGARRDSTPDRRRDGGFAASRSGEKRGPRTGGGRSRG